MKFKKTAILTLPFLFLLNGCPAPGTTDATPSYHNYYDGESISATPSATPDASATPYMAQTPDLSNLRIGVLPDASLSAEETKLAGFLVRKTEPVFPLKIGVLLYGNNTTLPESERRKNIDSFLQKLKANENIGQVIEISNDLISSGANIDQIRQLGARFQVSSVLVISEDYQPPKENSEAVVTPLDLVTGSRTWESYSKLQIYALDVLNGVVLFSTASGFKESEKYNKNNPVIKNQDNLLIKESAFKAWQEIQNNTSIEIDNYKARLANNNVVPVLINESNTSSLSTQNSNSSEKLDSETL